ncbi:type II secretion system GspH family protein [Patescibacteria group bacterium]|nr:type II secretion system GspH family protein [Patescibacteria group bacterium]MBU4580451.1 type II secretion system GspH family protein [Patescibacteria group bacterium]
MQFKKTINNKILKNKKGYTLIEMLLYVALLGIIMVVIVGVFFVISRTNSRIVTLIEINSNAYSAMERMVYEASNAKKIYLPTSNFTNYNYNGTKAAQFSLATSQAVPANESIVYIDFYLEDNTIFMKQEGLSPIALTSSNVSVQNLNFYYYKNGTRESVEINFTVKSNNILNTETKIDLSTVIALRS